MVAWWWLLAAGLGGLLMGMLLMAILVAGRMPDEQIERMMDGVCG